MEAARELRRASNAAAGTSHAADGARMPRRAARTARRQHSTAAQAVLQLPKLPSFRKCETGTGVLVHTRSRHPPLPECRKQQKEIKRLDDPQLESWLQGQQLPQQRVRSALWCSRGLCCTWGSACSVQVTLADCGAEGRGLVASGDIRQGEQILQVKPLVAGVATLSRACHATNVAALQVPDNMLLTRERCLELSRLGPRLAAADLPSWSILAAFLVDTSDQVGQRACCSSETSSCTCITNDMHGCCRSSKAAIRPLGRTCRHCQRLLAASWSGHQKRQAALSLCLCCSIWQVHELQHWACCHASAKCECSSSLRLHAAHSRVCRLQRWQAPRLHPQPRTSWRLLTTPGRSCSPW